MPGPSLTFPLAANSFPNEISRLPESRIHPHRRAKKLDGIVAAMLDRCRNRLAEISRRAFRLKFGRGLITTQGLIGAAFDLV